MKLAVLAIGGNVIAPPQDPLTWEGQVSAAEGMASCILHLGNLGYRIVLTHGNGPQVGAILMQNERASDVVPQNPLDVCVAQSQAQVGYALQLALQEELRRRRRKADVVPIITLVIVDPLDPAFKRPSKPIGPLYPQDRTRELRAQGWEMVKDTRGGFRRVVPSPTPLEIVGAGFLGRILERDDAILIAAGGGGIPVVRGPEGLRGVEAVIDKDLTSSLLASKIGAEVLIMITDVPCVYLDHGTERERALSRLNVKQAMAHLEEGQFPPGSMGPKVQAAIDFLRASGSRAIITDLEHLEMALMGEAGTIIVP